MILPPRTLPDLYRDLYRPLRLTNKPQSTEVQYLVALNHWQRFAGPVPIVAIDDVLLARFAAWLLDGHKPPTVNKSLRHVMALLRFAAKRKPPLIPEVPEFTPLRESLPVPQAFLIEELARILRECSKTDGFIAGVLACDWLTSLFLTLYDTGARIGAILQARTCDVLLDEGQIRLQAATQKQNRWQVLAVHPDTVAAWRTIWSPTRTLMWEWPHGRKKFYGLLHSILDRAGVDTWRGTGSICHRVRKSTASYCAAAGGDPTAQLGHSSPAVTARYLDPRIVRAVQAADLLPRPPHLR